MPIGLLKIIDMCKIELKVDEHIKSKCGVWPLMTQPKAIKPSNFFIFFLIAIGISKIPGTLIMLVLTRWFVSLFFELNPSH